MGIKAVCPECGGADTTHWCTCCMGPEPIEEKKVEKKYTNRKKTRKTRRK